MAAANQRKGGLQKAQPQGRGKNRVNEHVVDNRRTARVIKAPAGGGEDLQPARVHNNNASGGPHRPRSIRLPRSRERPTPCTDATPNFGDSMGEQLTQKWAHAYPTWRDLEDRFQTRLIKESTKEKTRNTMEPTLELFMRFPAEMEPEAQSHVVMGCPPDQKPILDLRFKA